MKAVIAQKDIVIEEEKRKYEEVSKQNNKLKNQYDELFKQKNTAQEASGREIANLVTAPLSRTQPSSTSSQKYNS